jgi:hypothetical protein
MTDRLDTLVKEAAPIDDAAVSRLALDGERELLEAILAEPLAPQPAPPPRRRMLAGRVWRRPRTAVLAAAGATIAVVLALAGVSLTSGGGVQAGPERAWAAQALQVADAVPRLLLDASGWRIARADQFTVHDGELTFASGDERLELRWLPARQHRQLLKATAADVGRAAEVEVLGRTAALFDDRGSGYGHTAVWRIGDYALELRSATDVAPVATRVGEEAVIRTAPPQGAMSRERFVELVASLELVGVDAWLAAMPASVVLPGAHADAVRAMLEGIPLPPGFAPPRLGAQDAVRDRYQLGAKVAGAVACAWIGRWVEARAAGDERAARAAVAAMASAREWPVLRAMNAEGGYPEVLWSYADAMTGDASVPGGKDGLTVEGTYREALGCDAG